jgi:hypothetical protein
VIVDIPAKESRVPCSLPDYIQPIVSSIATVTCDLSHLSDRNWVWSKVPALVLILSSMKPTMRIVPEQIVELVVDSASHIRQESLAIDILVHLIHFPLHFSNTADASPVVVASREMRERWGQHMRHNWWVVLKANYLDPC